MSTVLPSAICAAQESQLLAQGLPAENVGEYCRDLVAIVVNHSISIDSGSCLVLVKKRYELPPRR